MLRALYHGLLVFSLFGLSVSTVEIEFAHCNCNGEGVAWTVESIRQCQKVSDFLIATAYFSIPLEILYFVTCSNIFPFKWVLFQFGAFIILCGLTHLLTVFTYDPHSFFLMLCLTIAKFLTALVSFATAITLLTLIPQLLRLKVRENLLSIKARELDREVGMMRRQEEASWHVRMLTQEIRKSLDRHTILYTTLVELSKTLELHNCAVWMPNEDKMEMNLTHELRSRSSSSHSSHPSIPMTDPDVMEIKETEGVKILRQESRLGSASSREFEAGAVAAIRMPMLNVSIFKGGTPQIIRASYAILVLVLPNDEGRVWNQHEVEIVEVVADQVAVALSHAAVLEESQMMRDKLAEQNRALLQAKQSALMASEARNSFQKVMGQGMRRPIESIMGTVSIMQQDDLKPEQRLIMDTIFKTSSVVLVLINDVMEISAVNPERISLEMKFFNLHSLMKEASSILRCLCETRGYNFALQLRNEIPDKVFGDEKRVYQVILHMFGNLINGFDEGLVSLKVSSTTEVDDKRDRRMMVPGMLKPSAGCSSVKFEMGIKKSNKHAGTSSAQIGRRSNILGLDLGLSFSMCKKLVQLMQGEIWASNSQDFARSMVLILPFQHQPSSQISDVGAVDEQYHLPSTLFQGVRVLLAEDDDVNRVITRKLLEKLGCYVSAVASGIECLSALVTSIVSFQVVILDLHMPKMDGFEVATRIRKFGSGCWPKIIALTASEREDIRDKCLQAGMNGLIHKPLTLQSMRDELHRVVQNT